MGESNAWDTDFKKSGIFQINTPFSISFMLTKADVQLGRFCKFVFSVPILTTPPCFLTSLVLWEIHFSVVAWLCAAIQSNCLQDF